MNTGKTLETGQVVVLSHVIGARGKIGGDHARLSDDKRQMRGSSLQSEGSEQMSLGEETARGQKAPTFSSLMDQVQQAIAESQSTEESPSLVQDQQAGADNTATVLPFQPRYKESLAYVGTQAVMPTISGDVIDAKDDKNARQEEKTDTKVLETLKSSPDRVEETGNQDTQPTAQPADILIEVSASMTVSTTNTTADSTNADIAGSTTKSTNTGKVTSAIVSKVGRKASDINNIKSDGKTAGTTIRKTDSTPPVKIDNAINSVNISGTDSLTVSATERTTSLTAARTHADTTVSITKGVNTTNPDSETVKATADTTNGTTVSKAANTIAGVSSHITDNKADKATNRTTTRKTDNTDERKVDGITQSKAVNTTMSVNVSKANVFNAATTASNTVNKAATGAGGEAKVGPAVAPDANSKTSDETLASAKPASPQIKSQEGAQGAATPGATGAVFSVPMGRSETIASPAAQVASASVTLIKQMQSTAASLSSAASVTRDMDLILRPEGLGTISLRLELDQGNLKVSIAAERATTADDLQRSAGDLAASLADVSPGFDAANLTITQAPTVSTQADSQSGGDTTKSPGNWSGNGSADRQADSHQSKDDRPAGDKHAQKSTPDAAVSASGSVYI